MENSEIILLNINGEDKVGLTAALTEIPRNMMLLFSTSVNRISTETYR